MVAHDRASVQRSDIHAAAVRPDVVQDRAIGEPGVIGRAAKGAGVVAQGRAHRRAITEGGINAQVGPHVAIHQRAKGCRSAGIGLVPQEVAIRGQHERRSAIAGNAAAINRGVVAPDMAAAHAGHPGEPGAAPVAAAGRVADDGAAAQDAAVLQTGAACAVRGPVAADFAIDGQAIRVETQTAGGGGPIADNLAVLHDELHVRAGEEAINPARVTQGLVPLKQGIEDVPAQMRIGPATHVMGAVGHGGAIGHDSAAVKEEAATAAVVEHVPIRQREAVGQREPDQTGTVGQVKAAYCTRPQRPLPFNDRDVPTVDALQSDRFGHHDPVRQRIAGRHRAAGGIHTVGDQHGVAGTRRVHRGLDVVGGVGPGIVGRAWCWTAWPDVERGRVKVGGQHQLQGGRNDDEVAC